jgi:FlaA1/EpsC-like NDP-sugar epimerase
MRRKIVLSVLMVTDAILVAIIPFLSLYVRVDEVINGYYYEQMMICLPIIILVRLGTFYCFGLYHRLWRYASIHELMMIITAVTVSSIVLLLYLHVINGILPISIHLLSWFFNIALIGGSRFGIRIFYYLLHKCNRQQVDKVLIIGAGDAGVMIAREINKRYYETKKLVGFIDDSSYKCDKMIFGAKVLGACGNLSSIVSQYGVSEIIIAMPSVSGPTLREIIRECKATKCAVKTVPGIYELIDGKVSIQQLRDVDLEDLLRRDPVELDIEEIATYLTGKSVLVTGAGGSIGSELCRQIARMSPKVLALLGKGENSIYEIDRELRGKYPELMIETIIADVRDCKRMDEIFSHSKPQVVFHAAAHKHVPLMESQPVEAVRNNVFGTKTVAEAADKFGAEVFVMVSTDKAVNPTSVMGATKRVAELIIQNLSRSSNTKFVAVRFGNVLGSRGSVIPLFKKQIAKGEPITITHPDMKRYFMTIPEASQLVLQAGAIAKGGEVFVLDMGEPVKIVDMACDLIELSGLVPYEDIKIKFTGLRPGEKLFEELLTAEEGTTSTKHKKIFAANLKAMDEEKLRRNLLVLQSINQSDEIIQILSELIPTYQSSRQRHRGTVTKGPRSAVQSQAIENILKYITASELHQL